MTGLWSSVRQDGRPVPTQSGRRRFSQRTSGLPWNLTFAHFAHRVGDDDSGRSHKPTDERDKLRAERLHLIATN